MDGRVARGARNRQAVIDATLALIAEGDMRPSAQAVAARAGVATRSVFHHFDDLESLLADAAQTQAARHWHLLQPVDPGLDVAERIAVLVEQRAQLFEQVSATRRAAVLREHESPVLARRLKESRAVLRRHLRQSLAPEFARTGRDAQAAMEAAASWEMWQAMRRDQGLSVAAAQSAVSMLLTAALNADALSSR